MHPPLRLVIFGWRGVLWDNLELEYQEIFDVFHEYGLKVPDRNIYRKGRGVGFVEFCYANGLPHYISRERIREIRRRTVVTHPECVNMFFGARETLAACRNRELIVAIVTKEITEIVESRLFEFGLTDLVNEIRGGATNKKEKLLGLLKDLKITPGEAIFVEDTRDGLVAAKELGIRTLGVTYGHNDTETILKAEPEFPNPIRRRTTSLVDVRKIISAIANAEKAQ